MDRVEDFLIFISVGAVYQGLGATSHVGIGADELTTDVYIGDLVMSKSRTKKL